MIEIPADQRKALGEAFQKIESDGESAIAAVKVESVPTFCALWPSAKGALEFLLEIPETPNPVKLAIRLVIKAGDLASKILCP